MMPACAIVTLMVILFSILGWGLYYIWKNAK